MRVGGDVFRYGQSDHGYQPHFHVADNLTLREAGNGDRIMSVGNSIIVYSLLALAYLVTPAALIGGGGYAGQDGPTRGRQP